MKLYDVLDDLSWESYRDINLHHSWHNFYYLCSMNLDFSLRLSHCSQLFGGKSRWDEREGKKNSKMAIEWNRPKFLKGGKIEILWSRNFGIVICIREWRWLMMPNSKFCDDVESVVGVPISVISPDLTLFFTFSLSNHFIRWLRMPILPFSWLPWLDSQTLLSVLYWIRLPNF